MADTSPLEQPRPASEELLQLPPMTRADIGNLIMCADAVRRSCKLEEVSTIMALIEKLAAAQPVSSPT